MEVRPARRRGVRRGRLPGVGATARRRVPVGVRAGAGYGPRIAPVRTPTAPPARGVLVVHHRYRHVGGEEAAVAAHARLAHEHLGERVAWLERDSAALSGAAAASALVGGGLGPRSVSTAVRRAGADLVHAHNLLPSIGVRGLRAARDAGAAVVLHLHNYRLVCAVATCVDPAGHDCVRCHGRDTSPGLRLGCRGSRAEGAAYAAGIAMQRPGLLDGADVVLVPSAAARERLEALGADLPADRVRVVPHPVTLPAAPAAVPADGPALVVGRLAREKGVEVAIEAARLTGRPLVVCGDGPLAADLRARAADLPHVTFLGRLEPAELARRRASVAVELQPSRAHETFGLSAAEAMAAGVPVVASDVGALRDLVPAAQRVAPGDPRALAAAWERCAGDVVLGEAGRRLVAERLAPTVVASALGEAYATARARRGARARPPSPARAYTRPR